MAFESVPVSWEDSRRLCNMTGKDLASIESVEEWRFLYKTIQTMQTSDYFIGLKKQSGEWRWVSNDKNKSSSREYFIWAPYQPSGNGNCAKMFMSWYDDMNCDKKKVTLDIFVRGSMRVTMRKVWLRKVGLLLQHSKKLVKVRKSSFLSKAKI